MSTYQDRVIAERAAVAANIDKLQAFLVRLDGPEPVVGVSDREAELLRLQLQAMRLLHQILDLRVAAWAAG